MSSLQSGRLVVRLSVLTLIAMWGLGLVTPHRAQAAIVAQWKFDNNFNDQTANANHLTPVNGAGFAGPFAPVSPNTGSLLLNQASSQYAEDTSPTNLDFTGAYSVAGWIQAPIATSGGQRAIFWRGNGIVADIEMYIQAASNNVIIAHNRNAVGFDFVGFGVPGSNVPVHIAATFDGANVSMYYNGVLQAVTQNSASMNAPLLSGSYGVRIGSAPDIGGLFEGGIDELFVTNHALTLAEIQNLIAFNQLTAPMVPEPSAVVLMVGGVLVLSRVVRRRRSRQQP